MKTNLERMKQRNEGLVHVKDWLSRIGETDDVCIKEVLDQCNSNASAMKYYLHAAKINN